MTASMTEYLEADLASLDLLECVYGFGERGRAIYRVVATSDEPLTVDAIAEHVDRNRTTAYRGIKRLEAANLVEKHQVNYQHGGYYHVYEAVDVREVTHDMQQILNEWYATVGTLIGEFESVYGDETAEPQRPETPLQE